MAAPMEGIRITDFSWAWAVPFATTQFAIMGAEVIKIESFIRPELGRIGPPFLGAKLSGHPDESCWFGGLNANKLSISLDIRKPEAAEIIRELVKVSDCVTSNFRARVL